MGQRKQKEGGGQCWAIGNVSHCTDLTRSLCSCCCFCSASSFSTRSVAHSLCRLAFSFWWLLRSSSFSARREEHSLCRLIFSFWWLFTMSCFSERSTEHSFWRPLHSIWIDCNSLAVRRKSLMYLHILWTDGLFLISLKENSKLEIKKKKYFC